MSFSQFQLSYEISPIMLNGGISSNLTGGAQPMAPIIQLLQPQSLAGGGGSFIPSDFNFVAHFRPLAGATLAEVQVATYPFANQATAANAIIFQPLKISLLMVAPAPNEGGYVNKLSSFTSLQQSLSQHMSKGGTFTVSTPAFTYTDCLLVGLRDVTGASGGDQKQVQTEWQWDFIQPLITQAAAATAYNNLMGKASSQTQFTGDPTSWSGGSTTVGNPAAGVTPNVVTTATNLQSASAGDELASALQTAASQAASAFANTGAPSVLQTLPSAITGQ